LVSLRSSSAPACPLRTGSSIETDATPLVVVADKVDADRRAPPVHAAADVDHEDDRELEALRRVHGHQVDRVHRLAHALASSPVASRSM
jgi:hypothetical protein